MVNIIGVRFRDSGKVYHFSAEDMVVQAGQNVIVETARGVEYGHVVFGNRQISEEKTAAALKPVIRIATEEDDSRNRKNKEKSREAYRICQEKIRKHNLEMKLIDCEYTFDNNKVLFYFTADGRIDFRELVKDLASVFKTRIELRQIGVRDETKIKGGIGICGRSLCCHTFLSDFAPVSIKMAKEQNLSLNPTKISGMCGRLMCCLKNEQETYEYLNKKLPRIGEEITFRGDMKGVVHEVSVLRQRVKVIITDDKGEKELMEIHVDEIGSDSGIRRKKEKNPGRDKGSKADKEFKNSKAADVPRENKDNQENKDKTEKQQLPSVVADPITTGSQKSLIGADSLEENRRLYRMRAESQNDADAEKRGFTDREEEKKGRAGKNRGKGQRDAAAKSSRNSGQKNGEVTAESETKAAQDSKEKDRSGRRSRNKKYRNKKSSAGDAKTFNDSSKDNGVKDNQETSSRNQRRGRKTEKDAQSKPSRGKDNPAKDKKTSGKHYRNRNYRGKKRNESSRNEKRGEAGRSAD